MKSHERASNTPASTASVSSQSFVIASSVHWRQRSLSAILADYYLKASEKIIIYIASCSLQREDEKAAPAARVADYLSPVPLEIYGTPSATFDTAVDVRLLCSSDT